MRPSPRALPRTRVASPPRSKSTCRIRAAASTRAFSTLVDDIYTAHDNAFEASAPQKDGTFPGMGTPPAPPFGGKADLPPLAQQLHMEVDDLFPIAEVLQLLRFAELSRGDLSGSPRRGAPLC